jgi:hypothetical protein
LEKSIRAAANLRRRQLLQFYRILHFLDPNERGKG